MDSEKILIVGWENELAEIELIAKPFEAVASIVFDAKGHSVVPTKSIDADVNLSIEFLKINQHQFNHRESVLKAPSELAIWLYKNSDFDIIYCTRHAGLGYFVSVLQRTVIGCHHWSIKWFGSSSIPMKYIDEKRFLDKEGLLLSHIEKKQERELEVKCEFQERIGVNEIAVIIPFHNRSEYLPLALSSLAGQGEGLEVVIINDASSDNERRNLAHIITDDKFASLTIKIIDSDIPLGASEARNRGVANTSRDYIFFLDDDDILAPNALRLCCDGLSLEKADVVTVAFSFFDGDGVPDFENEKGVLIQFHDALDWSSALLYNCVGGISALYRRSVFEEVNGFQCSDIAGEEDWQLILKLSFNGKMITNIPLPLLWYRNTPLSLSKKMLRYESRRQLCSLYENVLPEALSNLPEFVTSTQHMKSVPSDELSMLGWELYPHKDKPIYIYGGGELGRAVLRFLRELEPSVNVELVIDRNAKFIREIMGYQVVTLEELSFKNEAVVIIASLSFVEEIEAQLPSSVRHTIRLKN